jgi:formiminotetrahydrofolate cyclodeaminase
MFSELSLKNFIEKLSSPDPTPGGGSASAFVAAFGFSLVSMVLGIASKKNNTQEVLDLIEKAKEYVSKAENLADKDTEAFNKVMDAFKLPKNSEEEKNYRRSKVQESLKEASTIPLELMSLILDGSYVASKALGFCPDSAISDLFTALNFFDAAMEGAYANVLINLKSIKDDAFVKDSYEKTKNIKEKFSSFSSDLKEKILSKLNIGG